MKYSMKYVLAHDLIKKIEFAQTKLNHIVSYSMSVDELAHVKQLNAINFLMRELEILLKIIKKKINIFGMVNEKYQHIYDNLLLNCLCNTTAPIEYDCID